MTDAIVLIADDLMFLPKLKNSLRNLGYRVLEATDDVSICGNVFSGLTEKAVTLIEESRGIVFSDNVLTDVDSDHPQIGEGTVVDNQISDSEQ